MPYFFVSPSDDNYRQRTSAHNLDLIYNIHSITKVLFRHNLPSLADFKSFLRSSKNIVVIHYISPKEIHELAVMKGDIKDKIRQEFKNNNVIDCKIHLHKYLKMIENALNYELRLSSPDSMASQDQFTIIKYWCVNMSELTTPEETAIKMGLGPRDNVNIIIVNWRGMGSKSVVKNSAKGTHLNNRVAMINPCIHYFNSWKNLISYSPQIIKTSEQFTSSLGLLPGDIFAAVHIRSEKLGLREPRMPGVTTVCFAELMRVKNNLSLKYPSLRFIYITDYGPYSSDTCKKCRGSIDIKKYLKKLGIHPTYFEPALFNVTIDNGVAAAVESQFLSSANFLFLLGGGGYQNLIANRFQEKKRKMTASNKQKILFKVCSNDSDINRLFKLQNSSNFISAGT